MSADLLEQLAEYGADHRARQAPVEAPEFRKRDAGLVASVDEPLAPEPHARPRFVLVAAAAVIVVLLAGLAFVVGRDRSDQSNIPGTDLIRSTEPSVPATSVEPLPTASTTVPSETTTPSTTAVLSTMEVGAAPAEPDVVVTQSQWTRVDGLEVAGVVSDGTSFFAAAGRGERKQLVRSDDGSAWVTYPELPDVIVEQFVAFVQGSDYPFAGDRGRVAVRDGRLVTVLDGRNSVTVNVVEADGTATTNVVPVEIPAEWEPFHTELNPQVHLIEDGRIMITAGYSANEALVEASGQSRAELGLPPLYALPRPIVISSSDGVTWTQLDTPRLEQVTPAPGGLVALAGPIVSRLADLRVSSSTDGAVWQALETLAATSDLDRFAIPFASGNRTFVSVQQGGSADREEDRIWEITADGPRLIAGGDAASEPLELLDTYFGGRLTGGKAGLAYVLAVDPWLVERGRQDPLPAGPGIRYSLDDGETWEFEAFPAELVTANPVDLAIGATNIVLLNAADDGRRELWVREFPD